MSVERSHAGTLTEGDALALIATVPVGRLVYSERALPSVTPVNFILDGADIIIRAGRRSPVATHAPGNIVAFEVDDINSFDRSGWSVVITGRVELINDADVVARLDAWHLQTWRATTTDRYVRLRPGLIRGQRLPVADSHSGFAPPLRRDAKTRS